MANSIIYTNSGTNSSPFSSADFYTRIYTSETTRGSAGFEKTQTLPLKI